VPAAAGDALVGVSNFLLRLWDSVGRRRSSSPGTRWAPTYRHEALPGYQAGRVFDDAILAQLEVLRTVESFGFTSAKADGFGPTTSSRRQRHAGRARSSSPRPTATRSSSSATVYPSCSR
jgi:hypothetical protein